MDKIGLIGLISLSGGGSKPAVVEELVATANGTYTPSAGVDGFSPVIVNIPSEYANGEEMRW